MASAVHNIFETIDRRDVEPIFEFLTPEEREEIFDYIELKKWVAEQIVMREGEPGDFMGFVVDGKLAVKKETSSPGQYIHVAVLDKGAMVGEASAFDTGKRTATVETMEDSTLLIITRQKLDLLFKNNKELGVKIMKRILHVLSMRLQDADDHLAWLL